MLRSRSPVLQLGPADAEAALATCAEDPDANVFVAARILDGVLGGGGGLLLGHPDDGTPGRWRSLVWAGANVVPVQLDPSEAPAYLARLRRRQRWSSSVFGPAAAVQALWGDLSHWWGRPRAVRERQPVMATTTPPSLLGCALDERVRLARPEEVDAVVPAAAAMFTEEIGYPPYVGSVAAYRQAVALLVEQGRTYVVTEGDEVVFKADVGSVALGVAQVQGVWLTPRLRGQGLAGPAMASVVEAVLATTAPRVSLYVNDFNARARATYAGIGMEHVGDFRTVLL
ncbi:DUF4081 domain-containing GNAT family N-acetyltransferase [Arsenicicoccus dermatophilus]|uniref:GNAT family N-acetyltransferase n=1 Tax=Arsenicicoccus dermatophilus TaxID=1076331 RepID=UPI001F4C64A6|nr:DUF4081 domain-containing GNAT family N-acetyltransferase [Arsenicicoccus dermatophilus]MCH8612869.1 DUF4081 domain-containing protein [Arsenicicoccus dermatophilus]